MGKSARDSLKRTHSHLNLVNSVNVEQNRRKLGDVFLCGFM